MYLDLIDRRSIESGPQVFQISAMTSECKMCERGEGDACRWQRTYLDETGSGQQESNGKGFKIGQRRQASGHFLG
jgi:hypothetical protein